LAAKTAAGLNTEEVAGMLGASPAHVRVLFNRAANSLRKELLRAIERERGVPAACRECRRLLTNPAVRNNSLRRAKMEEKFTLMTLTRCSFSRNFFTSIVMFRDLLRLNWIKEWLKREAQPGASGYLTKCCNQGREVQG
jgi:hypothetical protein